MSLRFYPSNCQSKDCFMAALYGRLSDEDKNKTDVIMESASITNQRNYLHYCVEQLNQSPAKWKVKIYREYYDDDYTGITFSRPGFQAMMDDVKRGLVDCIIVKDFSRFGRDHDRIKKYLEEDFEVKGHEVRFIAYADHYDSLIDRPDIGVRILLFLNEEYSRNQSYKVTTGMESMMRAGQYIGAFAPYGYEKDAKDKHHLVVDEKAAKTVKRIFYLASELLKTPAEIAFLLNKEQIPSPSEYKKQCGYKYQCGNQKKKTVKWSSASVLKILTNEVYTGTLIQHKAQTINLKTKKRKYVEREKQIRLKNRHEAIIPKEYFFKTGEKLKKNQRKLSRNFVEYPFDGLVFCKECGQLMVRKNGKVYQGKQKTVSYISYECRTHKNNPQKCFNVRIYESTLFAIIKADLLNFVENLPDESKLLKGLLEKNLKLSDLKKCRKENTTLLNKQKKLRETIRAIDEKWLLNKISDEERRQMKEYYEKKINYLKEQSSLLLQPEHLLANKITKEWIKSQLSELTVDKPSGTFLHSLIERIEIGKDLKIVLVYKFHS